MTQLCCEACRVRPLCVQKGLIVTRATISLSVTVHVESETQIQFLPVFLKSKIDKSNYKKWRHVIEEAVSVCLIGGKCEVFIAACMWCVQGRCCLPCEGVFQSVHSPLPHRPQAHTECDRCVLRSPRDKMLWG